jgi:hypothetical protein
MHGVESGPPVAAAFEKHQALAKRVHGDGADRPSPGDRILLGHTDQLLGSVAAVKVPGLAAHRVEVTEADIDVLAHAGATASMIRGAGHRGRSGRPLAVGALGRLMVKVAPAPTLLATRSVPPCSSISRLAMARPSPTPGVAAEDFS